MLAMRRNAAHMDHLLVAAMDDPGSDIHQLFMAALQEGGESAEV